MHLNTFVENCNRCGLTGLHNTIKAQRTPGNALVYAALIVFSQSFLEITVLFGINYKETSHFLERKAKFEPK